MLQYPRLDAGAVGKAIPPRRRDAHKRMNGTVCVIGGSRLYHGAPFLCGSGALRAGADLVYIAVPASIAPAVRALSPDFIVVPLPDGRLTRGNVAKLRAWVKGADVYAVGPGLGPQKAEDVAHLLSELRGTSKGVVVDADALLPRALDMMKGVGAVVTPHSGEFERLFGVKPPGDLEGRVAAAREQAERCGVVVLLKGPVDVITDGQRVAVNDTHSPAMTVGGTGDVLTGVVAGLMARGAGPYDAACAGAYVCGAAGLDAASEYGMHITASDVAERVAGAMKKFDVMV